jgi:hypothetical protein
MDSELIFETNNSFLKKVTWIKPVVNSFTEWSYVGLDKELKLDLIHKVIENHLKSEIVNVSVNKTDSFQTNIHSLKEKISTIMGRVSFTVWDAGFQNVIQLNKIGVLRYGTRRQQ